MKRLGIFLLLLGLLSMLTLGVQASDENFGEEDDFGGNFGQEDEFETEPESDTESDTESDGETDAESATVTDTVTEGESDRETDRVPGGYPPEREQEWALPIPVIWATIALVGICGTALAVMYLVKYFKQ